MQLKGLPEFNGQPWESRRATMNELWWPSFRELSHEFRVNALVVMQ